MCGRAAEETVFSDVSSNAGGDLKSDLAMASRLTGLLHAAVGLGGSLTYVAGPNDIHHLLRTDPVFRRKVDRHLATLYQRAVRLTRRYRAAIEAIAERLLERGHLSEEQIRDLFESNRSVRA